MNQSCNYVELDSTEVVVAISRVPLLLEYRVAEELRKDIELFPNFLYNFVDLAPRW